MNNNIQTDVVYFDFAKAFDSVNHDIVLMKLKQQFGINGRLLKFLVDYLSNRQQCVVIGGQKSEVRLVASGVPQGSILGPLLFVMFINDMFNCVTDKTNIALYADDTKIWREIINWDDHIMLQNDINNLLQWSIINKLTFHQDKCKVLSIARSVFEQILPFQLYFYKLGDKYLDYVDSEKDLGIIINRTFSNDDHCDKIYSIMNQKLGMLKHVCYFTKCQKQKRSLYLAIVRVLLNHCCIIWRPTSDTKIARFESIQKRAVNWILNEEYHHYSDFEYISRLNDLELLPIKYFLF